MNVKRRSLKEFDDSLLTQRQTEIIKLVQEQGFVTIEALAKQFDVSSQTIRREIIRLDDAKVLQRFHGGAGVSENTVRLGYAHKQTIAPGDKERIGRRTADLIPEGASLFLDVGTTVEAVARALRRKSNLRVFTCSLPVATLLAGKDGIETFLMSGSVGGPDGALVGDTAVANISLFKVDFGVFGCSGFDDDGTVMDFDLRKVAVKRAMLGNCRHPILVADSSKFGRAAIVRIAPLASFTTLVADCQPPARLTPVIKACNIEIVVT